MPLGVDVDAFRGSGRALFIGRRAGWLALLACRLLWAAGHPPVGPRAKKLWTCKGKDGRLLLKRLMNSLIFLPKEGAAFITAKRDVLGLKIKIAYSALFNWSSAPVAPNLFSLAHYPSLCLFLQPRKSSASDSSDLLCCSYSFWFSGRVHHFVFFFNCIIDQFQPMFFNPNCGSLQL